MRFDAVILWVQRCKRLVASRAALDVNCDDRAAGAMPIRSRTQKGATRGSIDLSQLRPRQCGSSCDTWPLNIISCQ